ITMEEAYEGPILIIKTAWGGQSLSVDYRSPGSGPYVLNEEQVKTFTAKGTLDEVMAKKKEATGRNYRYMIGHIRKVLGDIKRVYPDYDPEAGYELSGFVWFQGWNDFIDTSTYPDRLGEKQYDEYGRLLAQFIRDVRHDLQAPELPFVIGVMGVYGDFTPGTFRGPNQADLRMKRFRKAMAAPVAMAEFKGSVTAVQTAPFREDALGFLEQKQLKVKAMSRSLAKALPNGPNADGSMSAEERRAFIDQYKAEVFTPEEMALWERAASIGGFVH
ncbi:MAG: sialate O-acetylesterase, partial [Verrucomicrobiales bacterium]